MTIEFSENINLLLQKSNRLYNSRDLEAALRIATEALEQSNTHTYTKGIVHSNLLIGMIYNTSGRYQGNQKGFAKALQYIEKADRFNHPLNGDGMTFDILMAFGEVHQNKEAYTKANEYFEKALAYSQEQKTVHNNIHSLCALSQLWVLQNDFEKALYFANQALNEINQYPDQHKKWIGEVYNQLSQVFIQRQDYTKIPEYSEIVLAISQETGDVEKEISALNNIAIYYGVASDYKTAMQYFLEALDKSKTIDFRQNTAQCLINIGTIYAHLFNYKDAILRYKTVLKEYEDVLSNNTKVIVYNNLGNIYTSLDQLEEAEIHFEKALELARESNYKEMIAHAHAQLGRTNITQKKIKEAQVHAEQAQELITQLGDVNGKQINLLNLGNIYYLNGDMDEAIKLTSKAIVTASRMKDDASEIRGYQLLAHIYRELKDFETALKYQMIYSKTHEKYAKEQRNRQIIDLEIKNATKEKQKEIELLTKENEYQALLLKQSDQIAQQNARLLAANEELRQFAYVASHDLKEPLRMIGSYTQLIYREHSEQFSENSKLYYDFVHEGVVRMNNLLDALLKYATVGNVEDEMEEVKLSKVLDVAKMNLSISIKETSAVIKNDPLPVLNSSYSLLIQLFQNLLSNGIKFRKPETSPEIFVKAVDKAEEIIVSFRDEGIGISPEYKERIFIIFQRLHSRTKYKGTGIGLSICLKIMQRLGGRIWVESQKDEGATFFVAIPKRLRK